MRSNLFFAAINLAWAVRNFIMIGGCEMGECPQKHTALYIILFSSIVMMIAALFSDLRLKRPD
jgi:hypothetical protein